MTAPQLQQQFVQQQQYQDPNWWLTQGQQGYQGGSGILTQYRGERPTPIFEKIEPKKEQRSMVKEIKDDMRAFMKEHKSVIYWTLILYVVDHYCFEGALKSRLQKMVHNLVGKVEAKLDKANL